MTNRMTLTLAGAVLAGMVACGPLERASGQSSTETTGKRTADRQPLRAGDVNLRASRVYIFVDKTGFGHQHVVAGRLKQGQLHTATTSAGQLVFDMGSFVADTDAARRFLDLDPESNANTQQQVTATMLGPDVLDVSQFPTAVFEVNSLQPHSAKGESGKPQYQLDGRFTLHGTTRPLRITVDGTVEKGYLHLVGHFPLRQTAYKIRPFKKALGAVGVADELIVYGDLWIKP